jgi:hypothetical protein
MSESQNNNQDPNSADDEQHRAGSASDGQDVSGSFKLAQNPEQFFHGGLATSPDENGVMQTRSFSFSSSQFNPDPSGTPVTDPSVAHSAAETVYNPDPSASFNTNAAPPAFNPDESAAFRTTSPSAASSTTSAPAQTEPSTPASTPAPAPSFSTDPTALTPNLAATSMPDAAETYNAERGLGTNDFFDNPGRQVRTPQSFATQPQVFNETLPLEGADPLPPANYSNPPRQQPPDSRRSPAGFFDAAEPPGSSTVSGAPSPSGVTPTQVQKQNSGLTVQQAFFSQEVIPEPVSARQANSSFQDFYQNPTPEGEQFPTPGQQQKSISGQTPPQGLLPETSSHSTQSLQLPHSQPDQSTAPQLQPQQGVNQQSQQPQPTQNKQPLSGNFDQFEVSPDQGTQYTAYNSPDPNDSASRRRSGIADAPFVPEVKPNLSKGKKRSSSAPMATPGSEPSGTKQKRRPRLEGDDENHTESIDDAKFNRFDHLMTPETKGLLMLAFHDARSILFQPEQFFASMPTRGNIAEPAIFLVIVAGLSGLLAGIISMNLLITLQFIIGNVLQAFLLSFIASKLFTGMGSTEPFETTFRVIAYSQATLIVAGLKFNILGNYIPAYITLLIATVLALRLQAIGMQQVHDFPPGKTLPVLVGATLFIMLIRFKCFLL